MNSISLLTPCLNPDKTKFIELANSISSQSKFELEWLILDGGSNFQQKKFIDDYCSQLKFDVKFIYLPGSSIYSSLNYGINNCKYDYYLTLGCDDKLNKNALKNLFYLIEDSTDVGIANVVKGSKKLKSNKNYRKFINFYGSTKIITNHSVGCVIKKSLHRDLGLYDTSYKYLADSEFLIKLFLKNFNFQNLDFLIGEVGNNGVTSKRRIDCILEHYKIIKKLNPIFLFDEVLLILRLLKFKSNQIWNKNKSSLN